MMAGGKDEYKAMLKDTKRAAVAVWWPKAVDIIPSDGGKGVAVEKVLEYYHLSKEEAMAFVANTTGCPISSPFWMICFTSSLSSGFSKIVSVSLKL